jgi:amino acid transporter
LAAVHPRFHTPAVAILVQSAIALPLALTGSFVGLASLSVVARLVSYLGTAAAVPVLRRKLGGGRQTSVLPGALEWVIPIAATLVCLAFLWSANVTNLIAGALALVVGLPIYLARGKW